MVFASKTFSSPAALAKQVEHNSVLSLRWQWALGLGEAPLATANALPLFILAVCLLSRRAHFGVAGVGFLTLGAGHQRRSNPCSNNTERFLL